jgi:hypothetical protein
MVGFSIIRSRLKKNPNVFYEVEMHLSRFVDREKQVC